MQAINLNDLISQLEKNTPEIERQSYEAILKQIDLSSLDSIKAYLILRSIHATARFDYKDDLIIDNQSIKNAIKAIKKDAPIITDSNMLKSAINYTNKFCYLSETPNQNNDKATTKTAYAIKKAINDWPNDAIFAVGSSPTALFEIINAVNLKKLNPALVIGVPVGFIGAVDAKLALMNSNCHFITNKSAFGGAALGAALINSIIRLATLKDV